MNRLNTEQLLYLVQQNTPSHNLMLQQLKSLPTKLRDTQTLENLFCNVRSNVSMPIHVPSYMRGNCTSRAHAQSDLTPTLTTRKLAHAFRRE